MGGGLVGILLGIFYMFLWFFWIFGPLSILFNMLVGMIIGTLNGLRLGFLKFYRPISDKIHYKRRMRQNAITITFFGSLIAYIAVFYWALYPSNPNTVVRASLLAASLPTLIATFIARYASAKISLWNSSEELEVEDKRSRRA